MIEFENLPRVVDHLDEAHFHGQRLEAGEKSGAAAFLLSRQVTSGPHSGLLAPARAELEAGVALFTGERLHTHLGPRNVLSAEAGRLAHLLGLSAPGMGEALQRLQAGLRAACFAADLCILGECAHSGLGWMRFLAAGGAGEAEERIVAHLRLLAARRDGSGRWKGFPFHYTLLVLSGIDLPPAVEELRYAARVFGKPFRCHEALQEKFALRRQLVRERALARC